MPTIKEATLHYLGGSSDKIYRAWIDSSAQRLDNSEFVVNFAFGRRGSRLQVGTKTNTPVPLSRANTIYENLVNSKIKKGYDLIDSRDSRQTLQMHTVNPTLDQNSQQEDINSVKASYRLPSQIIENAPKPNTKCLPVLLNSTEKTAFLELANKKSWVFQEKLDGKRMIVHIKEGKAIAFNKRGLEIGAPSSILEEAEIMAQGTELTLDGECIGDNFYVFDILCHKNCLRDKPYSHRLEILEKLFCRFCGDSISHVPTSKTSKEKLELFDKLEKSKKEGVVAKHLDASYTKGRPNSGGDYLKFKFVKTASAIVSGHNQKHSVSLCLLDTNNAPKDKPEGLRVPIGNVTIPQSQKLPEIDSIIEVKYLYAMPNSNSLYQPSFLGKRDDIALEECGLHQLEYKTEG